MSMTFGQFIRSSREQRGMSRWKLKEESQIGITQIKRLEEGSKSCDIRTAYRLCKALNIENINTEYLQG
jgi:ribosome-binding protein aMBF1 (putative translation factor)